MYEKLVKRLRTATTLPFMNALCQDAADAIEELSLEIDMDNAALTEIEAAITRWIPVTERLPEDLERVLINDEDGVTIGTMDVFVGNEETYYEWHDTHCYRVFPTHWMPLPQPPKEERAWKNTF